MHSRTSLWLAITLIVIGATMRFFPHPANVAPIAAIALFSGVYLKRWHAFVIPLAAMILSDAVIGFHSLIWATWGCFLLVGALGLWVRRQKTFSRVVAGSLVGSVMFFLVTNWAVWKFTSMYDPSLNGLWASYLAAIPFFRNTVLGDLFFTGLLFGVYEGATVFITKRMPQSITISSNER